MGGDLFDKATARRRMNMVMRIQNTSMRTGHLVAECHADGLGPVCERVYRHQADNQQTVKQLNQGYYVLGGTVYRCERGTSRETM